MIVKEKPSASQWANGKGVLRARLHPSKLPSRILEFAGLEKLLVCLSGEVLSWVSIQWLLQLVQGDQAPSFFGSKT